MAGHFSSEEGLNLTAYNMVLFTAIPVKEKSADNTLPCCNFQIDPVGLVCWALEVKMVCRWACLQVNHSFLEIPSFGETHCTVFGRNSC